MACLPFFRPCKWLSNKSFRLSDLSRSGRRSSSRSLPPPSTSSGSSCSGDARFMEAFRRFDADGDGRISSQELRSFLAWAGEEASAEEAQKAIADFDTDGDGLLDYYDFTRLMSAGCDGAGYGGGDPEGDEDLKHAFGMFEEDKGSGRITPEGLRRMLCKLGDVSSHHECVIMIQAYDLDGDGELDYDDFLRMMTYPKQDDA